VLGKVFAECPRRDGSAWHNQPLRPAQPWPLLGRDRKPNTGHRIDCENDRVLWKVAVFEGNHLLAFFGLGKEAGIAKRVKNRNQEAEACGRTTQRCRFKLGMFPFLARRSWVFWGQVQTSIDSASVEVASLGETGHIINVFLRQG